MPNAITLVTGSRSLDRFRQTSMLPDERLLLNALQARGCRTQSISWNDPAISWKRLIDQGHVFITRYCGRDVQDRAAFLGWAEEMAEQTNLWNPAPSLRWNTCQRYLQDLERRGAPVLPQVWLPQGDTSSLAIRFREQGWTHALIQPVMRGQEQDALLIQESTMVQDQVSLPQAFEQQELLLQPIPQTAVEEGKLCLVFLNGVLSHAFRRTFLGRSSNANGMREIPAEPSHQEIGLAQEILHLAATCVGLPNATAFLWASVDLIRDGNDGWRLVDLDLVKPRLHLEWSIEAQRSLTETLLNLAQDQQHLLNRQHMTRIRP